jgi:hypothetical protein
MKVAILISIFLTNLHPQQSQEWFVTGQPADLMLSGIDFNNTGGPLLFNHPKGIATDGNRLLLADTYNNRILIWNKLPTGNEPPDLVLGQKNFITNNPGKGLDQLNWPVAVVTDGEHVIVADTENDRILIWNTFPTQNGQPADIYIQGSEELGIDVRGNLLWPWAVWTDGKKLAVTSTASGEIMIWNNLPTQNNQPPDIIIKLGDFGTPRSIGSDGKHLAVGDHNAFPNNMNIRGTFFWKTFPSRDDQMYDFFISSPEMTGGSKYSNINQQFQPGEVLWSTFGPDSQFIAFGSRIYIWNRFPQNEQDTPDFIIGKAAPNETGYRYDGGDGSNLVTAGNKLYLVLSNGNKIVGFNSLPQRRDQEPDFAIGAPDIYTNTLETYSFITNPVPITDGKHLFAFSDYESKLYVWRDLPNKSGIKPDTVYNLPEPAWDGAIKGDTLILAGGPTVFIWKKLPLNGEPPEIFHSFGNIQFQGLGGVAIDDKYFYLADVTAGKIYIWEGFPDANSNPKIILENVNTGRLSSDGNYLAVTSTFNHQIEIYEIGNLAVNQKPFIVKYPAGSEQQSIRYNGFNLPMDAIVFDSSLFIADTGFNRVIAWKNVKDAIAGKPADVILSEKNLEDIQPEIGRDKLFWPAALAFDGNFLWVGEFKFSNRLLRFNRTGPTTVNKPKIKINSFKLYQNYPNPFNSETIISFEIPERVIVSLTIHDVLGREVKKLISGKQMKPGFYKVKFDGSGLPSGVYFYKLKAGKFTGTGKMLILK